MGLSTTIKTLDQSTTSTTLVSDNDLNITISANTKYNISCIIYGAVTGLLGTYNWSITIPNNPTIAIINSQALVLGGASLSLGSGTTFPFNGSITGISNTSFRLELKLLIQNVSAGPFTFSFGASSGATVTTLAGSIIVLGT